MSKRIRLVVTGSNSDETAAVLATRLTALGYIADRTGNALSLAVPQELTVSEGALTFVTCPHDPPDFGAEKILDRLAERGIVRLCETVMSQEEEREMQDRLRRLGYIE